MAGVNILDLVEATEVNETDDYLAIVDKSDTSQDVTGSTKKATVRKLLGDKALPTGDFVGTTDTQTLTNKTLTSPVIDTQVSGTAVLDEDTMSSNSDKKLATQQSIKAYVDTKRASIAVPYVIKNWVNASSNYTTSSASHGYIDSTNAKATLTLKYGKLVMVDLFIGGLFNANIGYEVFFDIGLNGTTTKSTSGECGFAAAQFGNNWATDGTSKVGVYAKFYFVDCGTGSKDFYALWRTSNASYSASIAQYAKCQMYVTELFM